MSAETVVLAYSGGLDTSVAVPWLRETQGHEVVTLTVDVGGGVDAEAVQRRALAGGARRAIVVDARSTFVTDYIWPALQAGSLYQGQYPLATALARPLIARLLVDAAHETGAGLVAHGCTGKGNDQVRFDVAVAALDPLAARHRADAGRHGHDARRGAGVRARARHRRAVRTELAVQHRREPVGPFDRGRRAGGPVDRAAGRRVRVDRRPVRCAARGARRRHRLRGWRADLARRRGARRRHPGGAAERGRRRVRHRPDRPRRGSAHRHQEPRDLRGTRRAGPPRGARGARAADAVARAARLQAIGRRPAGHARLRRPLVQRARRRAARVRDAHAALRERRGPHAVRRGWRVGDRPALAALAVRHRTRHLRPRRPLRPRVGGRLHRDLGPAGADPGRGAR